MRFALALAVTAGTASASANDTIAAERLLVGGSIGYGGHTAQVLYRGTRVPVEGIGPALALHAGTAVPLGGRFEEAFRAGLEYRFAANDTRGYGMDGAAPSGSMTFLPFIEAITRVRGSLFLGVGPRIGLIVARGTFGTGTSAESATAVHPFVAGRLESGVFLGEHWQLGVALGLGVVAMREPEGAGAVADLGLQVVRAL